MSFILDALRKSELERKRQSGPTLTTAPDAPRRETTRWPLLALALLLALNLLGFLAYWIWRETRTPPAAAAPPVAAPPVAAPPVPAANVATPAMQMVEQRVVRPLAAEVDEAPAAETTPPVPAPPAAELLPARPAIDPIAPVAVPAMPAGAARAGDTVETVGVPRIDQLGAAATAGLPELNLDLHVYQPEPAKRFVFINGVRYGEGATMREGPVVERITRDGAVLNHRGVRFMLERP